MEKIKKEDTKIKDTRHFTWIFLGLNHWMIIIIVRYTTDVANFKSKLKLNIYDPEMWEKFTIIKLLSSRYYQ